MLHGGRPILKAVGNNKLCVHKIYDHLHWASSLLDITYEYNYSIYFSILDSALAL